MPTTKLNNGQLPTTLSSKTIDNTNDINTTTTRLKITGGSSGQVLSTDGSGNLSWKSDSVTDGDKGDITVSNNGATWTIDAGAVVEADLATNAVSTNKIADDAVTFGKMQNIATARLLGRGSAGTGDIEEIQLGSNLSLSGTTLNATSGGVTDGDKGDITVSSSGATWTIDNDAVTYAKIQNVSASRILGRGSAAGSGDIEELTVGSGLTLSGTTLTASGAQVQIDTYTGSGTYTKPSWAKKVEVYLVGAGGGGGSGASLTQTSARFGGGGGASGGISWNTFDASQLPNSPTTVSVTIGAGGTGGAARTNGNGNNGVAGGSSTFGDYLQAPGGALGQGGTNTGGSAGTATAIFVTSNQVAGTNGGQGGNQSGGNDATSSRASTTGGGGGGGMNANATTGGAGGRGGGISSGFRTAINGANAGTNATSVVEFMGINVGLGGGGGGAATTGGTAGGNASGYGGGGGGGGSSNDTAASGKGGNGSGGYCIVVSIG